MSAVSMAYLFVVSSFACAIVPFVIGIRLLKKPSSYLYNSYIKTSGSFYAYSYAIITSISFFTVLPFLSIPLICLSCFLLIKNVLKRGEFEVTPYPPNLDDNFKEVLQRRNLQYEYSKSDESSQYQIKKPNLTIDIIKKKSWIGAKTSYKNGSDKNLYYSILDEVGEAKFKLKPISSKRCLFLGSLLATWGCVLLFIAKNI